jgi:micrococcal nuclease
LTGNRRSGANVSRPPTRYGYRAIILPEDVYDGDSCTADISLGFGVWLRNQKLRLVGVDTPEMRGASRRDGILARDFVRELMPGDGRVLIQSHKPRARGKYGRWLCSIWIDDLCVNDELLRTGHATRYLG